MERQSNIRSPVGFWKLQWKFSNIVWTDLVPIYWISLWLYEHKCCWASTKDMISEIVVDLNNRRLKLCKRIKCSFTQHFTWTIGYENAIGETMNINEQTSVCGLDRFFHRFIIINQTGDYQYFPKSRNTETRNWWKIIKDGWVEKKTCLLFSGMYIRKK